MRTAYTAGPMRGIRSFNFPAFFTAEIILERAGYRVINPARHEIEMGLDVAGMTGHESLEDQGFNLRETLAWDLRAICLLCDTVVFLPGWRKSLGARAEYATARALGLECLELDLESGEMTEVHDDNR